MYCFSNSVPYAKVTYANTMTSASFIILIYFYHVILNEIIVSFSLYI